MTASKKIAKPKKTTTPPPETDLYLTACETAVSLVRTASRALKPLADADAGGTNEGAELVALDVVATLEEAANMFDESLLQIGRTKAEVSS